MKDFLASLPGAITAVTFAVLCLTVVHEWAFYSIIGDQFQSLMSVTDYFSSALGWLPAFFICGAVGIAWRAMDRRLFNYASPELVAAYYRKHRLEWFAKEGVIFLTVLALVVGGLFQLLLGNVYAHGGSIDVAFLALWMWFITWLIKHGRVKEMLNLGVAIAILIVPPLLEVAYMRGSVEGFAVLSRREPVYLGKLKGDDEEKSWFVLRNLSRGVIVRELDTDKVSFLKWDDVTVFQKKIELPDTRPLVCRITGWACPPSAPKK